LLRESPWYFGNNPRQSLEVSSSLANLKAKRSEVESAIKHGTRNKSADDMMQMMQSTRTGGSDVAYMIFLITPSEDDKKQLLSDCYFDSVSKWSLGIFMDELDSPRKQLRERAYAQLCPGRSQRPI
jgi:hypothetical protein